jgi:hypothetical protein
MVLFRCCLRPAVQEPTEDVPLATKLTARDSVDVQVRQARTPASNEGPCHDCHARSLLQGCDVSHQNDKEGLGAGLCRWTGQAGGGSSLASLGAALGASTLR